MLFPAVRLAPRAAYMPGDGVIAHQRPRAIAVALLPANPAPFVEAAVEVLGGLELVIGVGYEAGAIALRAQQLRDGVELLLDRPPAGRAHEVSLVMAMAMEGIDAPSRMQRPPDGQGRQGLRVGAGEQHRLRRQRVEVGGGDPVVAVTATVVLAPRIDDD